MQLLRDLVPRCLCPQRMTTGPNTAKQQHANHTPENQVQEHQGSGTTTGQYEYIYGRQQVVQEVKWESESVRVREGEGKHLWDCVSVRGRGRGRQEGRCVCMRGRG
jgi:hypothetical protein